MYPDCINLRERFGKKYRIAFDPCYDPKHRPRESLDPWYMLIPCRHGHISPAGDNWLLACSVNTRIPGSAKGSTQQNHAGNNYTKALRSLCDGKRYILTQDGDDGISIEFDIADFEVIAEILKPHRKPRLTKEQRLAASKRMHASKLWLQTKTNSQLQRANSHAKHPTRPQGHVDTKAGFFGR